MPDDFKPDFTKSLILHRYEIYIPITDNNGKLIEPTLFEDLENSLFEKFGGVSVSYPYGGAGGTTGVYYSSISQIVYRDKSAVFMILSKDDPKCLSYFTGKRAIWEAIFKQVTILIMLHTVQNL